MCSTYLDPNKRSKFGFGSFSLERLQKKCKTTIRKTTIRSLNFPISLPDSYGSTFLGPGRKARQASCRHYHFDCRYSSFFLPSTISSLLLPPVHHVNHECLCPVHHVALTTPVQVRGLHGRLPIIRQTGDCTGPPGQSSLVPAYRG